jgi:hypothetical protein
MAVKTKKDSQEAYFLVQLQPKLEKANANMSENLVMEIDKPYFAVRLYKDVLQIDLKGSFKNEIEEALENKPFLRITIGSLLGIFVPLHIRLSHIDSARIVNEGKVKLILPYRRNVLIPLAPKEAKKTGRQSKCFDSCRKRKGTRAHHKRTRTSENGGRATASRARCLQEPVSSSEIKRRTSERRRKRRARKRGLAARSRLRCFKVPITWGWLQLQLW